MSFHWLRGKGSTSWNRHFSMRYHISNPHYFQSSELGSAHRCLEGCGELVSVEEDKRVSAVAQLSAPNFLEAAVMDFPLQKIGLYSEGILVNGDDFFIAQDFQSAVGDVLERAADKQRRLESSPKREMTLVLLVSHSSIAYFEHVWIIPRSWPCVG